MVLKLSDLLLALHDGLLRDRFVALQLNDLLLHMIVLFLLLHDACLQVLKVGHDIGVDHFHVLVILRREMIFHQADFLSEHLNFFLILSQGLLGRSYPFFHPFDLPSATLAIVRCNLRAIGPKRLIASGLSDASL